MNTLKKGDKVKSPYGLATIEIIYKTNGAAYIETEDGKYYRVWQSELTRISSFDEEMENVLGIAWDVENRLEDNETVQLTVGQFVKFARHYVTLRDVVTKYIEVDRRNGKAFIAEADAAEKLLKGETL